MVVQLSSLRVSAEMDASNYSAGARAKVAADNAMSASSAQAGTAISQTQTKVSQAGDLMTRLSRQYVEGYRTTEQFNRAVMTLGRGIETGNIPLTRAGEILDGIYAKFNRTASATELMAKGEVSLASAITAANARFAEQERQIEANTTAAVRLASVNDNAHGGAGPLNTANVAAQFQDVFVTSQMGMNPLQIALQQGTQLSAVLGNQGAAGAARTLGAALMSVVSPVSLLTIGAVAGTAAIIQWGLSAFQSAEDATAALERHNQWLDRTLTGYDDIRQAASKAADEAMRMPSASAALELGADREKAQASLEAQLKRIYETPIYLAQQAQPALAAQLGQVQSLVDRLAAGSLSLNQFDTQLRQVKFSEEPAQRVRGLVDELLNGVSAARNLTAELNGAASASDALSVDTIINGSFSQLNGASSAIAALKAMTPDLRTPAEKATAIYETNSGSDASGEIKKQLDYTLQQIAAEKALQDQMKASRSVGRTGEKSSDRWDSANDNFQQRIDSMRLEQETFGQSTYVIERNNAAFDLLNQAKQAGIPITTTVIDQINRQSAEYASVSVEMEKMYERQQQIDQINGTLASGFSNLFQGILNGSQTASQGIGNLLNSLSSLFINKAFQMVFSGPTIGGGLGGGGGGGLLGGKIIPGILHDGGIAGSDGYGHGRSFSPSVWNGAVRYHTGGIAGLRPNEVPAILERGETITPRNRSGVISQTNDNRSLAPIINIYNQNGSKVKTQEKEGPNGRREMEVFIQDTVRDARRRGTVGF